jgi:hypothetical protein
VFERLTYILHFGKQLLPPFKNKWLLMFEDGSKRTLILLYLLLFFETNGTLLHC